MCVLQRENKRNMVDLIDLLCLTPLSAIFQLYYNMDIIPNPKQNIHLQIRVILVLDNK